MGGFGRCRQDFFFFGVGGMSTMARHSKLARSDYSVQKVKIKGKIILSKENEKKREEEEEEEF